MARFSGKIGFSVERETSPGVYMPETTERTYRGDLISWRVRLDASNDSTNKNLTLNNDISIIADKFAKENIGYMVYVVLYGAKWQILSATIDYPRIQLTIGGMYNE